MRKSAVCVERDFPVVTGCLDLLRLSHGRICTFRGRRSAGRIYLTSLSSVQVQTAYDLAKMSGMYVNASLSLIGLCALTGAGVAIGSGNSLTWVLGMLIWCKLQPLYLALPRTIWPTNSSIVALQIRL